MANFVLVHGGWQGGWVYKDVDRRLRAEGHEVYRPTLTGLGERSHLLAGAVNLGTHIQDVVNLIKWEELDRVVLCGHSYGGMVITGVADAVPEKVDALVYLDAYVPRSGESCWGLTSDWFRKTFLEGAAADGFASAPPGRLGWRATAHPFAALRQDLVLHGNHLSVRKKVYVLAADWSGSPFPPVYERCKGDPAWETHVLPCGHDIMAERPDELVALLVGVAAA